MGKGMVFIGILGIFLGIGLFIKTNSIVRSIIPILLGILLIIFNGHQTREQEETEINS